ncbi:hypothetical protein BKA70DRAFT_1576912 [Coprinopsis sp. MPI-PUGE-AT-0042]|nr:hypothetical protein BKA70DRAFT_1576912 [Coprinopsis sp. MPI-PUGE-AT-0042]
MLSRIPRSGTKLFHKGSGSSLNNVDLSAALVPPCSAVSVRHTSQTPPSSSTPQWSVYTPNYSVQTPHSSICVAGGFAVSSKETETVTSQDPNVTLADSFLISPLKDRTSMQLDVTDLILEPMDIDCSLPTSAYRSTPEHDFLDDDGDVEAELPPRYFSFDLKIGHPKNFEFASFTHLDEPFDVSMDDEDAAILDLCVRFARSLTTRSISPPVAACSTVEANPSPSCLPLSTSFESLMSSPKATPKECLQPIDLTFGHTSKAEGSDTPLADTEFMTESTLLDPSGAKPLSLRVLDRCTKEESCEFASEKSAAKAVVPTPQPSKVNSSPSSESEPPQPKALTPTSESPSDKRPFVASSLPQTMGPRRKLKLSSSGSVPEFVSSWTTFRECYQTPSCTPLKLANGVRHSLPRRDPSPAMWKVPTTKGGQQTDVLRPRRTPFKGRCSPRRSPSLPGSRLIYSIKPMRRPLPDVTFDILPAHPLLMIPISWKLGFILLVVWYALW